MKQIIFTTILGLVFSFSSFAQNEESSCPVIEVNGSGIGEPGAPMSFAVTSPNKLKNYNVQYEWTTSEGTIVNGQGSSIISIDTNAIADGIGFTVQVKIKGLPENCNNIDSETAAVSSKPFRTVNGFIVDRWDVQLSFQEQLKRFNLFFTNLNQTSKPLEIIQSRGIIWIKLKKSETIKETKKRIGKLFKFAEQRKFPKERLIFLIEKEKYDSHQTTLWFFPKDAEFPNCDNCEIINGKDF